MNGQVPRAGAPIPQNVLMPFHVVVDGDRLFVTDTGMHRVVKFSAVDNMHAQQGSPLAQRMRKSVDSRSFTQCILRFSTLQVWPHASNAGSSWPARRGRGSLPSS